LEIEYNKVIRDRIPEIIRENGNDCEVKILTDEDFLIELEKKIGEELVEYLESREVMELADMIEVIYRVAELKGYSVDSLDNMRREKAQKRGAFNENLFLIKTFKM